MSYGDFSGTTAAFNNVSEDAAIPGHPAPLFDTPTVSGDTLNFTPNANFNATASNGASDTVDSHLSLTLQGLNGNGITAVNYSESGTFNLNGPGSVRTAVSIPPLLTIMSVNGQAITPININASTTTLFTPNSSGIFDLADYPSGTTTVSNAAWSATSTFDIATALANAGYGGLATQLDVVLGDTLVAQTGSGTSASIYKTAASIGVETAPVPVPASGILTLLGLASMGWFGWRRQRARAAY